ncbi:Penicillin-binding protein 1A [Luteitalea pratensis]|uniref:Biosynthetic peptidoglycan transglycosylase n=1 Tax=Luteitalea pratensis TaxID=1855912 RepID=A0A143PU61_LUTPR|nr:monofunctional biosynthetic peptidoglycan transglycosylase [Luteitalea pratensis]AMY12257.1 Penicillin-binding protein 1A [Luteitalea pratensis]
MCAAPRRRRTAARPGRSGVRRAGQVLSGIAAAGVLYLGYLALTVPDVRPLVDAPPADTAFMRLRDRQAHAEGHPAVREYRFVPYTRIAQTLKRAVLVTEDSGFWDHDGIEIEAIKDSLEANLTQGTIVRGGSTITQQLAKNLYLSPTQNPLRKLSELMITRRLERLLSKRRILELYLNVVEWGGGTWGAEAASRRYFRKPASGLGASEAALLAGALINPNRYSPADPPPRLRRRQQMILRRMGTRGAPVPPSEYDAAPKAVISLDADTAVESTEPSPSSDSSEEGSTPRAPVDAPSQPAPTPDEAPARPLPTPPSDT